tara:strand:- start:2449 stop:2556 length:108 start_codon:yes stop_codon:yes gene_type:complete
MTFKNIRYVETIQVNINIGQTYFFGIGEYASKIYK